MQLAATSPRWANTNPHCDCNNQTRICPVFLPLQLLVNSRHVFDDAERQLLAHCSFLQSSADSRSSSQGAASAERCSHVLALLRQQRREAEYGCEQVDAGPMDAAQQATACQQLESLELLLRELAYSGGGAEDLYRVRRADDYKRLTG